MDSTTTLRFKTTERRLLRAACAVALLIALGCGRALLAETPVGGVFETAVHSGVDYPNPFQEVEASVEFTAPSGRTIRVPAFWDGDSVWKARVSPNEPGDWRYQWACSDESNSGIHGRTGEFSVVAYTGDNVLHVRGAVQVAPEGRYFTHADGTPFFWLADTAWNGVLLASSVEWSAFLADRSSKRFSAVQFVALPWRSALGNENGRPAFYGRERISLDIEYFRRMDKRVEAINSYGLLAAPVMFWTHVRHVDLNPGMYLPEEQLIRLGRYMIARYGAFHVAWILAGDGAYEGDRLKRWKRVGRALFGPEAPGQRRPVTIHPTYWCGEQFEDEEWWTFNGYQSGHRRIPGAARIITGEPAEWWKSNRRPVINLEPSYEAHRNRTEGARADDVFDALDIRRASWHSVLVGPPAGVSYGAHGVWAWHPKPEEPMTHAGTGIGPAWHDAMHLPGSDDLRLLAELLTQLDWPNLRPAQELLLNQPGERSPLNWISVARNEGTLVAYSPSGGDIRFAATITDYPSSWWFSPRTGEWLDAMRLSAEQGIHYRAPSRKDWVLILTDRQLRVAVDEER